MELKEISCVINGQQVSAKVQDDMTLLFLLRDVLGLTGTKEGCGEGDCGAYTVQVNGKSVNSCLYPALRANGKEILTIEGVAKDGELSRIQKAFLDNGAIQCGFCSPGMIMSVKTLMDENEHPTDMQIRRGISGNLCRCTGYQAIVNAVRSLEDNK